MGRDEIGEAKWGAQTYGKGANKLLPKEQLTPCRHYRPHVSLRVAYPATVPNLSSAEVLRCLSVVSKRISPSMINRNRV